MNTLFFFLLKETKDFSGKEMSRTEEVSPRNKHI